MSKGVNEQVEEFLKGLRSIGQIHLLHEENTKGESLYLISITLNKKSDGLIILVTNTIDSLWRKEFQLPDFNTIRKRMGMEGSYLSYFDILRKSLLETGNGSPEIYLEGKECFLKVKYQISKGVTLTGNFYLESPVEKRENEELFKNSVSKAMLEALKHSKAKEKELELENKSLKARLEDSNKIMKKDEGEWRSGITSTRPFLKETEGAKKKKAKTDLINPNTKKRRAVGLKFEAPSIKLEIGSDSD